MQVNNIYMNQTLKKLTPLLVVFTVLLSSNFINAAWSNPTATPPGDNPLAPINESLDNQLKQGDITVRNLKAGSEVWSVRYCDENGEKCVDIQEVRDLLDGSSPSPTPTFSNCTLDGATVAHGSSRRFYSRTSATNCNSYDQNRTCNDGTLSGSNSYRNRSCSTSTPAPTPIYGCTDSSAYNYDRFATRSDGSCTYAPATPSGLGHTCESNGTQVTVYWNNVNPNAGYDVNIGGTYIHTNNWWYTHNLNGTSYNSWSVRVKNAISGQPWSDFSNTRLYNCR
jgi:hypothetical protein